VREIEAAILAADALGRSEEAAAAWRRGDSKRRSRCIRLNASFDALASQKKGFYKPLILLEENPD
jgi:hypothetical protein